MRADNDNQNGDTVDPDIQQSEDDQTDTEIEQVEEQEPEVKAEEVKPEVKVEEPKQRKPRGPNKPKAQEPTIGRIVHYVTSAGTIRPAIITLVSEETVDLTVFNSQGAVAVDTVSFDNELPGETPGTAFWPERN